MTGSTEPEGTARHRDERAEVARSRRRALIRRSRRTRSTSAEPPQHVETSDGVGSTQASGGQAADDAARSDRTTGGQAHGLRGFLRRVDRDPLLLAAADWLRDRAPGDRRYGDPLSVGGNSAGDLLGRRLASRPDQPSVFRELGMGALQVWQAHADRYPQEPGGRELAVLFTDLAGFSDWTLQAGDETALELLRRVGAEIEPRIERRGTVVKRLGDGLMAVFEDPDEALAAAVAARDAVDGVVVDGHRLRLRAGVHVGHPQKLSGDYFGRDVNIAARVAAAAEGGEVLISSPTRDKLVAPAQLRRRTSFTAKGVPEELNVYTVTAGN